MQQLKHLLSALLLMTNLSALAQVSIGTATPDASSQLDVSSTSMGFLTPSIADTQRNSISGLVKGLVICRADCGAVVKQLYNGSFWTGLTLGAATSNNLAAVQSYEAVAMGQSYGGGIIAYILQPGDPGYDASVPHGIIAAQSDQSTGITWDNGSNINTNAISTAIGTGDDNTTLIVNSLGTTGSYAAKLCSDLVLNGYTDWYLPSKDELNKLYINKVLVGGFAANYYWSSSELNGDNAWPQSFGDGFQTGAYKGNTNHVRAVRSF